MTSVVDLENKVRKWVEDISGRECYIQEQMGPIPVDPYCTIYMKEIVFPGYDVLTHECITVGVPPNESKIFQLSIRGQAQVTFAISAWGGTAARVMQLCSTLRNAIQADQRWTDLWTISGKGLLGSIISIPEDFEGERRQRAEFNLTLHTALQDNFVVDHFDETEITCTIDGNKEATIRVSIDDLTYGTIDILWSEIQTPWGLLG